MHPPVDWRNYLSGLPNFEAQKAADYAKERPDLAPYKSFLAQLGLPDLTIPTVIIAGSKGKGTTAAVLSAMFLASDRKPGLYQSPHVRDIRERIRIGDADISDAAASEAMCAVEKAVAASGYPITWFEAMTACALLSFRTAGCNPIILEVGLGGRLDATNACEPLLSLIASLQLEHTAILGDTLSKIAKEKAAVMRRGKPAFSLAQPQEAADALREYADSICARLRFLPPLQQQSKSAIPPVLRAGHSLACAGYIEMTGNLPPANYLSRFRLEGRYDERALRSRHVLLDVAHTPPSVAALMAWCTGKFNKFDVAFSALSDKDWKGMLAEIAKAGPAKLSIVQLNDLRAVPAEEMVEYARSLGAIVTFAHECDILSESGLPLVVTGSFRIVTAFLNAGEMQ